jgi:hypothetical protein
MTYQEFRDSPAAKLPWRWYRVTIRRGESDRAVVLQWEPGNAKWYAPEPFEGRDEAGYTNDVWFQEADRRNWRVEDVVPLVPEVEEDDEEPEIERCAGYHVDPRDPAFEPPGHDWKYQEADDGTEFRTCRRCGKGGEV